MSSVLGGGLLVVGFVVLFRALGLARAGSEAVSRARGALSDLRSPELDDLQKEKALQAHALRLFALFLRIAAGGAAAVLLPVVPVWLLSRVGLLSFDAVMELAISWPFVLASAVVATGILFLLERR